MKINLWQQQKHINVCVCEKDKNTPKELTAESQRPAEGLRVSVRVKTRWRDPAFNQG